MEKGITFLELLLVVAIIILLGASATPFYSRFITQNNIEVTYDEVMGSIRKAQEYAMDGKNDEVWGVCLTGANIRLYSASCSSPTLSEDFSIPSSINVVGFNDTTFNLRGEPSGALSITVSSSLASYTIEVNYAGGMEIY